jgi:2OG-Fe(II) oxygenase superfamily
MAIVGPGSFFKAHIDTPQSPKMFGSLVVILPTKHKGGTLHLRHQGQEWTFNSADLFSAQSSESPHAAFVAFFGNVEHKVSMVTSGYRVTLTYNLYFEEDKPSIIPSILPIDNTEGKIKRSLIKLLNDETFLPNGGLLGFSLSHLYPLDSTQDLNLDGLKSLRGDTNAITKWVRSRDKSLDKLGKFLKGADAAIKRAFESLSLDVSVKAVYKSDSMTGVARLLNGIADAGSLKIEDDIVMYQTMGCLFLTRI